jgi:CheY-like chemotaxis protein
VLVADDDPVMRLLMLEMLEAASASTPSRPRTAPGRALAASARPT